MDIARPDLARAKKKRRLIYASTGALALLIVTVVVARLKPAAPSIDKNLVWVDTVKRGSMIRQVRGIGTLVPEEIRWIAARTQGRVDRRRVGT
jgi:HlyD family secretion protein